jgi:hypothetical protein
MNSHYVIGINVAWPAFDDCEGVNMTPLYGTGSVSDLSINGSMAARESL